LSFRFLIGRSLVYLNGPQGVIVTPEQKARVNIAALRAAAGWHVCNVLDANIHASTGVARRRAQHVRGMYDLRQELIGNGVLTMQGGLHQFTQDYAFSAPSTAAAVVLGRSTNGRVEWKAADGRTLKEIQEAEAGQQSCFFFDSFLRSKYEG
jgi:hypothetical protein